MNKYEIELEFIEPLLGTVPKDKEIYASYIQKKVKKSKSVEDEIETVAEAEEKSWTGFHLVGGKPIIYDYVLKGFFKDACSMMRRVPKSKSSALKAHKKVIDGLVFISPRRIAINLNGGEIGVIERPLRAQTPQGERVALARSDYCPPGSKIKFNLSILGGIGLALLKEWLNYGELRGLGQWRNAGYGSFVNKIGKAKA